MGTTGFLIVTLMDIIGAVIISLTMYSASLKHYSFGLKAGFILAMIGLLGQAMRNFVYMFTGNSPTDASLPIWAFKDAGIFFVAFFWLRFKLKDSK
jgi:hypothetical protein